MKTNPVKTLVIDRKTWINGNVIAALHKAGRDHETVSALVNSEGRMCCLGFYAQACGVSKTLLVDKPRPSDLGFAEGKKLRGIVRRVGGEQVCTTVAEQLMTDNDLEDMPSDERESRIAALFQKIGVAVKYTGEYPKFRRKRA